MEKKAKPPVKAKKQPGKVPAEYVFWCHDGSVFADLEELAEGLAAMSDDTYAYHCNLEKQDFSNWVRHVIKDEELAMELAIARSRVQAAEYVASRIALMASR